MRTRNKCSSPVHPPVVASCAMPDGQAGGGGGGDGGLRCARVSDFMHGDRTLTQTYAATERFRRAWEVAKAAARAVAAATAVAAAAASEGAAVAADAWALVAVAFWALAAVASSPLSADGLVLCVAAHAASGSAFLGLCSSGLSRHISLVGSQGAAAPRNCTYVCIVLVQVSGTRAPWSGTRKQVRSLLGPMHETA